MNSSSKVMWTKVATTAFQKAKGCQGYCYAVSQERSQEAILMMP